MSGPELTGGQLFSLLCALGAALSVMFIALVSRANHLEDDGPDTLPIGPAPDQEGQIHHGDMVDIGDFMRRYSDHEPAQAPDNTPHPPHRQCGCQACALSFTED
jgi:hypothetical protein